MSTSPEKYHRRDLLILALEDIDQEKFLSKDMAIHVGLSILIANVEPISTSLALVFKLLADNLSVLQELTVSLWDLLIQSFPTWHFQFQIWTHFPNILGRPVVVSTDPELSHLILQQEGKLVEMCLSLTHFGVETLQKGSLPETEDMIKKTLQMWSTQESTLKKGSLPETEDMIKKTLQMWSTQESTEVKYGSAVNLFGYDDSENTSEDKIREKFTKISEFLMSIPLNIPGTTYHKCLKDREKATKFLRDEQEERRTLPDLCRGDLLDQVISDLKREDKEKFLSDDFIITVINEPLRLGNGAPGLLRRALKDIEFKAMVFLQLLFRHSQSVTLNNLAEPACVVANKLNPEVYKDPPTFNPAL
ncbi:hypothetical protein SADUNF_Sadunf04G0146300 [Salix dunnii]|uniref:Uncharacterized protein n=1 Tax=Salix dunnii TaxID=1413687 RepID=A0A835K7Q9_9ROSI|nr:hypothetical protein SADUNF_Sadunf04G0146300 [Salix dunnii]